MNEHESCVDRENELLERIDELEHYNWGLANEVHELKSLLHEIDLAVRKNDWPKALEACLKSRDKYSGDW